MNIVSEELFSGKKEMNTPRPSSFVSLKKLAGFDQEQNNEQAGGMCDERSLL